MPGKSCSNHVGVSASWRCLSSNFALSRHGAGAVVDENRHFQASPGQSHYEAQSVGLLGPASGPGLGRSEDFLSPKFTESIEMMDRWQHASPILAIGLLVAMATVSHAAAPTPEKALALKPVQAGVDYEEV